MRGHFHLLTVNPVINSGVKRGFVSNEFDESSGPQAERRACGPSFRTCLIRNYVFRVRFIISLQCLCYWSYTIGRTQEGQMLIRNSGCFKYARGSLN